MALDPLLRSEAISTAVDNLGYRGRRILLPWAASVLGLGQPWYVLQMFALLNVICWLLLGVLLLRWLPARSIHATLAWMAVMLGEGLLASMRFSLVDGPSTLLLALAVRAVEDNRRGMATAILAASGLARETNLIGSVVLVPGKPGPRPLLALMARGLLVGVPLALWTAYLWSLRFSTDLAGARNFDWPAVAYVEKWRVAVQAIEL